MIISTKQDARENGVERVEGWKVCQKRVLGLEPAWKGGQCPDSFQGERGGGRWVEG